MKQNRSLQFWLSSAVVGLALTAAPNLGRAADIVYTFDSDVQGWYASDSHGTVEWDSTHGRNGNGCLKYTLPATDTEIDPRVSVNFDTTQYFSIECDIMVDPDSGVNAGGKYGDLQLVARDSGGSWDSMWYGDMQGPGGKFGTWHHVKKAFTSNYGPKASVQFQIYSGAVSSNMVVYIDNVVIRDGAPGTKVTYFDFSRPEDVTEGFSLWSEAGTGSTVVSQDTNAAPLHPDGSMKVVVNYQSPLPGNGWEGGDVQMAPFDWDPSKFTFLDFDLYVDAPTGLSTYGIFQVFEINSGWGWTWLAGPGLSSANLGKWTHYSVPLSPMALSHGLIFQPGGGITVPVTYYVDNVVVWRQAGPPKITSMRFEPTPTGAGAEVTMNAKDNQWQRDAICVPGGSPDYSWVGRYPISYTFTITNFPDAAKHPGFEAHLFIVNESTIPGGAGAWNETYGACDWNAADLLKFTLENAAAGGTLVRLNWKTNTPGGNPPDGNRVVNTNGPAAIGAWALNFDSNTTGTITGPGGFSVPFTLPAELAAQFDPNGLATNSFIQFGMGQNDGTGRNVNYNCSGVFSSIGMTGGLFPFVETFPGPDLSSSGYSWRTTGTAVQWTPAGVGGWVSWTTPDDGYGLQVSPELKTWSDTSLLSSFLIGNMKYGAVPAGSLPPLDKSGYFRLKKP